MSMVRSAFGNWLRFTGVGWIRLFWRGAIEVAEFGVPS